MAFCISRARCGSSLGLQGEHKYDSMTCLSVTFVKFGSFLGHQDFRFLIKTKKYHEPVANPVQKNSRAHCKFVRKKSQAHSRFVQVMTLCKSVRKKVMTLAYLSEKKFMASWSTICFLLFVFSP